MNTFTEVYSSLITLLQTATLDSSWSSIETELKGLCQVAGPDSARSDSLKKTREKIDSAAGIFDIFSSGKAHAQEILKAAQTGNAGFDQRAAMVKTFKHFYCVAQKGSQTIWVVDHPKAYTTWAFDQLSAKSVEDLKVWLQHEEEVFGAGNRNMMSDALQLARKWSMDAIVKLGAADDKTLAVVKRWFHADAATDLEVKATAAALLTGFQKIANACNSGLVIFSDRPHKRADEDWNNSTYASVRDEDVLPIIYIFQVFLNAGKRTLFGNIPKLWLCALTVVHELSHKTVKTDDICYDQDGLKPGGMGGLTPADAIKNADSWAYFCADVVNVLAKATIDDVLK